MKATHFSWRKLTAIVAACILLLVMAGCGASNGAAATEAGKAEAGDAAEEKVYMFDL